jgi:hypothetical protein
MYERHAALRAFLKPQVITAGEKITAGCDFASAAKIVKQNTLSYVVRTRNDP